MKIGFLTERMLLGFGVDLVVHEQASRLQAAGHEVTVFTARKDAAIARDYPVEVLSERMAGFTDFTSDHAVAQFFADAEIASFDAWVLHTPPFYSWVRHIERPVVFVDHGSPPGHLFDQATAYHLWRSAAREVSQSYGYLRAGDGVLAISESIRASLPTWVHPYARVIHHGADHYRRAHPGEVLRFRRALKISDEDFMILWVGRMQFDDDEQPYKGFAELRALMPRLNKLSKRVKIVCLGKIDAKAQAAFAKLDAILVPNAPPEQMGTAFAAADVLLNLSTWEGFNLALVEAQFQGTPVVAYDVGPHDEVVAAGKSGLLVHTPDAVVATVRKLMRDPALKHRLSLGATEFAKTLTWADAVEGLTDQIRDGIAADRSRPPLRRFLPSRPAFQPKSMAQFGSVSEPPPELTSSSVAELLEEGAGTFLPCAYALLLGREIDLSGLGHYQQQLDQGKSRLTILRDIARSREFRQRGVAVPPELHAPDGFRLPLLRSIRGVFTRRRSASSLREVLALDDVAFVRAAYRLVLDRDADPEGMRHYLSLLRQSGDKYTILSDLRRSPEFKANAKPTSGLSRVWYARARARLFGGANVPAIFALNDTTFVEAAYQTVLGREPDSDGLRHYLTWLRATGGKREILLDMVHSEEGKAKRRQNGRLHKRLLSDRASGKNDAAPSDQRAVVMADRLDQLERAVRSLHNSVVPAAATPTANGLARQMPNGGGGAAPMPAEGSTHTCLRGPGVAAMPEAEARLLQAAQDSGADIFFGDEFVVGPDGSTEPILRRAFAARSFLGVPDLGPVAAVRKGLLEDIDLRPDVVLSGDLLLRLVAAAHTIGHLPLIVGSRTLAMRSANRPSAGAIAAFRQIVQDSRAVTTRERGVLVLCVHDDARLEFKECCGAQTNLGVLALVKHIAKDGGVAAINKAVAAAAAKYDFIAIVDSALRPLTAAELNRLCGFVNGAETGSVSALTTTFDDRIVDRGWHIGPDGVVWPIERFAPFVARGDRTDGSVNAGSPQEVSATGFGCTIMRRALFVGLGGLDERLPCEEASIDLSLRLRELDLAVLLDESTVLRGRSSALTHALSTGPALDRLKRRHRHALAKIDTYSPSPRPGLVSGGEIGYADHIQQFGPRIVANSLLPQRS